MDKILKDSISQAVENLLDGKNIRRSVKFLSKKLVVRATRKIYNGKILKDHVNVFLSICPPNYKEKQLIKNYKDNIIGLIRTTELRTPKK